MHIYYTFLTFLLGLVLASFLNALLYRIDNGFKYPDIFSKGSHCEKCGKLLKTYELIPVLSFFIFKGKCPVCSYKIPLYYPISEFFLGIGMASIYFFSLSPTLLVILIFFFCFSYFDRIYKGIPKVLVDIFLILSSTYFFCLLMISNSIPDNALIIGLILSLLVFLLGKIFKKPFGLGDILVLLGLSLLLDLYMYLGFIYVFLFISTSYTLLLLWKKKIKIKTSIPLLPFMYISLNILFLFNIPITNYLEGIFGF
jgi:prepilin signal peptidase PulO-like enzyme (type II secretory pathway)